MNAEVPSAAEIRAWAMGRPGGHLIPTRGAVPRFAVLAWNKAHPNRPAIENYWRNHAAGGQR